MRLKGTCYEYPATFIALILLSPRKFKGFISSVPEMGCKPNLFLIIFHDIAMRLLENAKITYAAHIIMWEKVVSTKG